MREKKMIKDALRQIRLHEKHGLSCEVTIEMKDGKVIGWGCKAK